MRFLVDLNIGVSVAAELRRDGYDALHARERDVRLVDDAAIFRTAADEGWTIVTGDLDFTTLAVNAGSRTSVILLRLRNMRADSVVRRLRRILPAIGAELPRGIIVTVEDARHRIHRLPFGTD